MQKLVTSTLTELDEIHGTDGTDGMTVELRHDSLTLTLQSIANSNTNPNPNPIYSTNPNSKTWPSS